MSGLIWISDKLQEFTKAETQEIGSVETEDGSSTSSSSARSSPSHHSTLETYEEVFGPLDSFRGRSNSEPAPYFKSEMD